MTVRAVPAVTRAVAILRLLGRTRTPMGMKAISQALGIVPSTALHILRVLVAEELIKVDAATKQYSLGTGLLSLARTALEGDDFPSRVQPGLDDLARRYGVMAIGVEVPNLTHMIVVALARSQAPVRLHVDAPACRRRQPLPRPDQRHRPLRRGFRFACARRSREGLPRAALAQCAEL
jgi:DNA-binding IclR family transcriptional regulator